MLEIICVKRQLRTSFQNWIKLIWTWRFKSGNNNNQIPTFFFRGYGEKLADDEEAIDMECEEIKL